MTAIALLADRTRRALDSDLFHQFKRSPLAIAAAIVALVMILAAGLAPWIAPQDPNDLSVVDINDARLPPVWEAEGDGRFLLGTDEQGRDLLSGILYGARISLVISVLSVAAAMTIGVSLGLISGYVGGRLDALIMRVADVQLSFPSILIALLISGVARTALAQSADMDALAPAVLVAAISFANWVQYARTVRSSTLIERNKEYVQAARVMAISPLTIMRAHILPNVLSPVLVIATINLATAIITEATLSFLGVGIPPTSPSLGTMVNAGNRFLFSGEWWLVFFPGAALLLLCISVNLVGDWLRDALNPRLR